MRRDPQPETHTPGDPRHRDPHPATRTRRPAPVPAPAPRSGGSLFGELRFALASPAGGLEVLEVPVRRDDRRALDAAIRALVSVG